MYTRLSPLDRLERSTRNQENRNLITSIYARMLRGSTLWMPVVVATFLAPVPAAADQMDTPMSNVGVIPATESATKLEGIVPFAGTGKLAPQDVVASTEGWTPSGDEIRGLPPGTGRIGIESVLGVDTRIRTYTTTYPARAIALITFTGGYCTGWFFGPNIVATAGHCVHSGGPGGSWMTNVRVYPGYNAGTAPYGSFAAKWLASVAGWTGSSNEQYDYGVIKLSSNVGNTVGWFGIWYQTASLTGLPSIIAGYPGDKSPLKSQWITADVVRVTQERQVFYKDDTFGGESGSPVWQDRPAGSASCSNGPCTYAIHGYGLHGSVPHSDHNHGARITQTVFNNLITWRNAP
jgi:glutamyl endopeptidase